MSDLTVSEAADTRNGSITDITDDGSVGPFERMAESLASPDWAPTRAQVAWLMAQAYRWGAEAGEDAAAERNLAYVQMCYTAPLFSAAAVIAGRRQQTRRDRWYEHARTPRDDDYQGGPVAAW